MTWVRREDMLKFFDENVSLMKSFEVKYACDIISQLDFGAELTDTTKYFEWLKTKQYATHRRIATFAMRCFQKGGGIEYNKMKFSESKIKMFLIKRSTSVLNDGNYIFFGA